ncbi:hypothetical protein OSTOST_07093 [Ostertagia ostertagi]
MKHRIISQQGIVVLITTGIVNQQSNSFASILLYGVVFFVSTVLVTNSFIYRYLNLCRAKLVHRVSSKRFLFTGCFFNLVVLSNASIVLYFAILPDKSLADIVINTVVISGINMRQAAFFGVSLKYGVSGFRPVMILELVLLLAVIASINLYCGMKIKFFLRKATQTSNFLTLQRQMFLQMSIQAACPVVFLMVPYCIAVFFLFTGIETNSQITIALTTLLASRIQYLTH